MAIRMDKVVVPAPRPNLPNVAAWLLILLIITLVSVAFHLAQLGDSRGPLPEYFWFKTLRVALSAWVALLFIPAMFSVFAWGLENDWKRCRQERLADALEAGRQSQQVLAVSLHTALRVTDAPAHTHVSQAQLAALSGGQSAIKAQPTWTGDSARHTHLPREEGDTPGQVIQEVLSAILNELAPTLARLPPDTPLDLLLEIDSAVPDEMAQTLWEQAWQASGIRQKLTPVAGSGLGVVDRRLDSLAHHKSPPPLLVVALQIGHEWVAETGEVAVGLLLGNVTSPPIKPLAYLHRPERDLVSTQAALSHAIAQALEWVPLPANAVRQVWSAGIQGAREQALTTVLNENAWPLTAAQGMHRLDTVLGLPGLCAPWLAIGAAVQAASAMRGAQLVVSSVGAGNTTLWCSVVTPFGPQ